MRRSALGAAFALVAASGLEIGKHDAPLDRLAEAYVDLPLALGV